MSELLTQAEIDALLNGMDDGEFEIELGHEVTASPCQQDGGIRTYDFGSQEKAVQAGMPTLERVNERFSGLFRLSLFNFLRRSAEIRLSGIQMQKFSEYMQGLQVPTSLTIVRFSPLRGRALIAMEPRLVFAIVDNYFGGSGQYTSQAENRDFSPAEMRVIRLVIEIIFKDLKEAWKPVLELDLDYLSAEINPRFAAIVEPSDVVVISTIHVGLEGGGGDINITMPYSMIEPVRDALNSAGANVAEDDGEWRRALRNEILRVELGVNSRLVEKSMTIRDVICLKTGDVIPIEMPDTVTLNAQGIPVFEGKAGLSDGNYAIKIINKASQ